jgi:hypothetical protein
LSMFDCSSSCVPSNQTWTIQRNWQHWVHKRKSNQTWTIQRNWQHRVHKRNGNLWIVHV